MTPVLEVTIPGAPRSPNQRGRSTRSRMALTKAERERAFMAALCERNLRGWRPLDGPVRITFTCYRRRLLDPLVNLPASLKATQDGLCRALLPLGDGPGTPYRWLPPAQVLIRRPELERVVVRIEVGP